MRSCLLPLVTWLLLASTASARMSPPSSGTVTILHTNDMHARYLPGEAAWVAGNPRPLIGGFVRLSEMIDSLRTAHQWTVTLDAGDIMTGNPISDLDYGGAQGGLLIEMMNILNYDAWSPGNHEFDISQENLRALLRAANFPSLAANLADSTGAQYEGTLPYTILTRGGLRIGIVGLISQQLSSLVLQRNLVGIRVLDPSATLERWIRELDPITDLLVALTHQGYQADSALAEEVSGLDIIVGGHSHTRLRDPRTVNGVLIVQAGSYCENLGVLTITVEDDRVASFNGTILPLWAGGPPTDGPLVQLVDSVRTVIEHEYGEVILTLSEAWRRNDPRQRLAIAVTEAQREAADAEVAFMNRGGIRRDLQAGPVTRNDLYEALPFRNVLGTFRLSGRDLREILEHILGADGDVVVTGLSAEWTRGNGAVPKLTRIAVGDAPLDPDRSYRCVASDYFLGQFDRYCGVESPAASYSALTVFEAVERALSREDLERRLPEPALLERKYK